MVYLDLIFNLALLVALSVVSGFLDKRFSRDTRAGALLQGALFSAVANPAACRLLGYSEEELIARGREGVMDREDPRLAAALAERERTGKFAGELTMIHRDGNKIPVELSTAVFRDRFGQSRTSLIVRNITRRLQEEESIKKLQALLAETQRLSKIGGWELDPATGRIEWTEEFYQIHGIRPGVPLGKEESFGFFTPEDRPVIAAAFRRLLETGEPYDLELKFNKASGESLHVRTIGRAEWKNGKIVRVFGNLMDITDRKDNESKQLQLFSIVDSSLNEIYVIDAETLHFVYLNQGALKNIGYTMDEMRRMTPPDIKPPFTMQDFSKILEPLRQGSTQQLVFEAEHRRKDGSVYPVDVYLQLHGGAGRGVFFAIINDISERKAAENRILRINEELEQKVQERTDELTKTIAQLEELNRVFVGRELKMAQLKNKIEELEKKRQTGSGE